MVLDEVVYMTADVEDEYVVAQANEPLDRGRRTSPTSVSPAAYRDVVMEVGPQPCGFHGRIAEDGSFRWRRP